MVSPLFYSNLNYCTVLMNTFTTLNPVTRWLAFGKLPENPIVTPTSSVQLILPSAENKFLNSVTVNAIPTTPTP
jgi:hypothetical protein